MGGETKSQGLLRSSAAGGAVSYTADAPTERDPEESRGPERTQLLSTRGPDGWSSREISPADHEKGQFTGPGEPPQYRFFSEDLSLGLVVPVHGKSASVLAEPPLSPPVEFEAGGKKVVEAEDEQEKTIYLHQDAGVTPSGPEAALEQTSYEEAADNGEVEAERHPETFGEGGFLALLTSANVPAGTHFGGLNAETGETALLFRDASHNLAHVVVSSSVPLTAPPSTPGLYEWSAGNKVTEPLQQVSILPTGEPDPRALHEIRLGARFQFRNAISTDGSLVDWEDGENFRASTEKKTPTCSSVICTRKKRSNSASPSSAKNCPSQTRVRSSRSPAATARRSSSTANRSSSQDPAPAYTDRNCTCANSKKCPS